MDMTAVAAPEDVPVALRRRGWSTLRRQRSLVLPLTMCAVIVLVAIIGPFVTPYGAAKSSASMLAGPSWAHWFGTDDFGRDIFSRMLAGTRVSITVGIGAVLIGMLVGGLIGVVAGLRAGTWMESALMRFLDLVLALPLLVVASVLAGITGGTGLNVGPIHLSNVVVVTLIIALVLIPIFGRLARASTLAETGQEYIVAARVSGVRERRIIFGELLPNVISPLIVQASLSVGTAISTEAALSFLGLGVQLPQASWGNILQGGQSQVLSGAWWLVVFPTAAIVVTVLSFLLLGEHLRDQLDPRSARHERAKSAAKSPRATSRADRRKAGATFRPARRFPERHEAGSANGTLPLLEIEGLTVSYGSQEGAPPAVADVSLSVRRGEVLGIVGESGSGKSTVLRAIMRLLPADSTISSGTVRLQDKDLLTLSPAEMSEIRGSQVGMVFQDPVNVLNPSFTVVSQLERVLRIHRPDIAAQERRHRVLEMLSRVGLDASDRLNAYPFEFSQGQLQRIAIAATCLPGKVKLLLADEPTTSLDVTVEGQVMSMLDGLRRDMDLAEVLVSHDIALVSQHCDRLVVMYAARVVEEGPAQDVIHHPKHPYTAELIRSLPDIDDKADRLYSMRGELQSMTNLGRGCPFAARCPAHLGAICDEQLPPLQAGGTGRVACHAFHEHRTPEAASMVPSKEVDVP